MKQSSRHLKNGIHGLVEIRRIIQFLKGHADHFGHGNLPSLLRTLPLILRPVRLLFEFKGSIHSRLTILHTAVLSLQLRLI